MSAPCPVVAVRGSTGISLNYGPPAFDPVSAFTRDDSKSCRGMFFSPDGKYFAWFNGICVKVVLSSTWKIQCEIPRPKVSNAAFSPLGTYLITWEPYIDSPNLQFFKADTGELVKAFIHKNQAGWAPQWSSDESLCARLLNNDVLFYENHSFETSVNKCSPDKVKDFKLSPLASPSHVLCYLPGSPGQPTFIKLFQYPNFDPSTDVKASKSFFQSDRVEMTWNSTATGVLVTATSDIDKSGSSYYGKQTLHFLSTKGDAHLVPLGQGSVFCVQWNPKGHEFCVVYGVMPAKASLFNLKCEVIHNFGTGARNSVYYNPFGNLLLLAGFGNLRGGIEMWDPVHKRLVAKFDAPETTQLQWSPDGEHFVTATCAPRLRTSNGFKIWSYNGKELYERPWNQQEELWEVTWQTFPAGTFKEPSIRIKPGDVAQNAANQAAKVPYRPPSARVKEETAVVAPPVQESISKKGLKLKKKREAKKAKKEDNPSEENNTTNSPPSNHFDNGLPEGDMPADPEKQKKIKKLKSKLAEIVRLRDQLQAGKTLELNQVEKLKKEDELKKELSSLYL